MSSRIFQNAAPAAMNAKEVTKSDMDDPLGVRAIREIKSKIKIRAAKVKKTALKYFIRYKHIL
jgi:hypothetical protein